MNTYDLKFIGGPCNVAFPCAICGQPGARVEIRRPHPEASQVGLSEVAKIHPRHLTVLFFHLPAMARQTSLHDAWQQIDQLAGRLMVSRHVPPVRTKLVEGRESNVEGQQDE